METANGNQMNCVRGKCSKKNIMIMHLIVANVTYIMTWMNHSTTVAVICRSILYSIAGSIIKNFLNLNTEQKGSPNGHCHGQISEEIFKLFQSFKAYIKEIVSCQYMFTTIRVLLELFILSKVLKNIPDRFLIWVLMNIFLLYKPLNKKYPDVVNIKYIATCWRQSCEGVFDLISAFVPRYEEK